jgi:hypothetical protein
MKEHFMEMLSYRASSVINHLRTDLHLNCTQNSHSASEGMNTLSIIKGSYLMLDKEVRALCSENRAQDVRFLSCIREVSTLNLGRHINCYVSAFSLISSVHPGKGQDSTLN